MIESRLEHPMPEPEKLILAITGDDTLMHVAAASRILEHVEAEREGAEIAGDPVADYEFYDADATRHELVDDGATGTSHLRPSAAAAEPTALHRQLLVDRIDAVLARMQVARTGELIAGTASSPARVPRVQGELPEVLAAVAAAVTLETDAGPNPGNWVHNLGHRFFG